MGERASDTVVSHVDSGRQLIVSQAALEGAVLHLHRGVDSATDAIVDVLAKGVVVVVGRVASFEAEDVGSHEVVPVDDLVEGRAVNDRSRVGVAVEGLGEHKASKWIPPVVGSMGIHLPSIVRRVNVH